MSETTEGLSAALAQSASESFAQLAKQKAFASAIQDFQAQLTKDLELERRGARKIISNLVDEVQSEWHAVFNRIFGNANTMATKVDDINMVSVHTFFSYIKANLSSRTWTGLLRNPNTSAKSSTTSSITWQPETLNLRWRNVLPGRPLKVSLSLLKILY